MPEFGDLKVTLNAILYIRAYLGVHNKTSNLALRGEVGWVEPDIRRKLEMIRMWARLISMATTD